MELLAQASPVFSGSDLAIWLGILLFVFSLIVAARKVFGHEPPLHKEFVSRMETEVMKSEIAKIDNERRTSVAILHAKVDGQTHALRVELNAKIERLEERIDAVPDRTIKLLRETKGLI